LAAVTAIVGGGISGLALAYALKQRGEEAILFESTDRVGGTIRTFERDGFWTETGPNAFLDREPAMGNLLSSLDLLSKVQLASPASKERFLLLGGKLLALPSSPLSFLTSRLLPLAGRLRVLGEIFSRRSSAADESFAEFGRRHFGKTATSVLLDAIQLGIFAGDLNHLSAVSAFPQLKGMEREHRSLTLAMIRTAKKSPKDATPGMGIGGQMASFEGGLQRLISALERALEGSIQRSAPVESIHRDGDDGSSSSAAAPGKASPPNGWYWPFQLLSPPSCCVLWIAESRKSCPRFPMPRWRWCTLVTTRRTSRSAPKDWGFWCLR